MIIKNDDDFLRAIKNGKITKINVIDGIYSIELKKDTYISDEYKKKLVKQEKIGETRKNNDSWDTVLYA